MRVHLHTLGWLPECDCVVISTRVFEEDEDSEAFQGFLKAIQKSIVQRSKSTRSYITQRIDEMKASLNSEVSAKVHTVQDQVTRMNQKMDRIEKLISLIKDKK